MKRQQSLGLTVIRVLLFWLATIAVFAAASAGFKNNPLSVLIAVVLAGVLSFFFSRWQKMKWRDVRMIPTLSKFLSGILIGSGMAVLQMLVVVSTGHGRVALNHEIPLRVILSFLLMYFLLAFREELVFRGFALRSIQAVSGPFAALIATTVLFIAEHIIGGMAWWPAIWGTGMGALLFGAAALVSGGLALPVGIHFAWNAMQWTLGFKNSGGPFRTIVEKGYEGKLETIASVSYVVIMAIAIAVFIAYGKKHKSF